MLILLLDVWKCFRAKRFGQHPLRQTLLVWFQWVVAHLRDTGKALFHQGDINRWINLLGQQHRPSGIFFEFVPADEIFHDNPTRLRLADVEIGANYALIINNNAGLWGYNIGDTVAFVSKAPYRLKVTGRIKHFISAFGEHVIGKEVEAAMLTVTRALGVRTVEFTVAPQVKPPEGGLPYHEWLVEFEQEPADLADFARQLDAAMVAQSIYYQDLIAGNILQPLKIRSLPRDAFRDYMKTLGKLGGQNKVPRLSNDRDIATQLIGSSAG